jgi:hypothetical protein
MGHISLLRQQAFLVSRFRCCRTKNVAREVSNPGAAA